MPDYYDLEKRVVKVETDIAEIKTNLQGVAINNLQTGEMYEVFNSLKGGFAVIEWLGRAVKPLIYIGTFLAAGYAFMKTGIWSKP